jgi:hypothetical protein
MKEEMYLKEIDDMDWVTEIIEERFDNALSFMTESSVIYGGAIRDAIAGLPLLGDLDIAATARNAKMIVNEIRRNPRWVVQKTHKTKPISSYEDTVGKGIVSEVISFENEKGRVIQIIPINSSLGDSKPEILMAKRVDIVCCGMVLTADGRVFEAVPGAYEDCRSRILRINDLMFKEMALDHLMSRVDKLVARGWISEIDPKFVNQEQERRKEQAEQELKEAEKSKMVFTYPEMANIDYKEFSHSIMLDPRALGHPEASSSLVTEFIIELARRNKTRVVVIKRDHDVTVRTACYSDSRTMEECIRKSIAVGEFNIFLKSKSRKTGLSVGKSTSYASLGSSYPSTSTTYYVSWDTYTSTT